MSERMPCHISDGPQTPEEAAEYWDFVFNQLDYEPTQEDRDKAAEERGEEK
jgi:hypothetical protein